MRPITAGLLALAAFLVLAPLSVPKPGLPLTLKADEPAYYLSALSLARDFDLRVEVHDVQRLAEEFAYSGGVNNLILMSDDGWRNVYFGKPFIYPLLAAPFAALAGANGMVSLNMLLLLAMVAMATSYLSRYNPPWLALLFSLGFFLCSSIWSYSFWLHPELFNMAAVMASLYLAFRPPSEHPLPERWWTRCALLLRQPVVRQVLSGAAIALAAYNKPMLALLGLAPFLRPVLGRRWREAVCWLGGAAGMMLMLCALSWAWTGHPSAYLGVTRSGVSIDSFDQMPIEPVPLDAVEVVEKHSSWHWIFRMPGFRPSIFAENLGYFFVGRHTGLFVYHPFVLLCLFCFFLHRGRGAGRWALLGSLAAVCVCFLVWIDFNWHGGGGFIGNRYFVNAVPAFIFLVRSITPAWLPTLGYGAAGLLLGGLLWTPLGAPVIFPTLQAHVRNPFLDRFPMEFTISRGIPGYRGVHQNELWVWGRRDEVHPHAGALRVSGGREAELWIDSLEPLGPTVWEVENIAPGNEVVLDLGGQRRKAEFPPVNSFGRQRTWLHFSDAVRPNRVRRTWEGVRIYTYRMGVHTTTGRAWGPEPYLGAMVTYLGPTEPVPLDVFAAHWRSCELPESVVAGSKFTVEARLENRSPAPWSPRGYYRVEVGWRWSDADGQPAGQAGRGRFEEPVAAGTTVTLPTEVVAPDLPGSYLLSLEPVYTRRAWFSEQQEDAICERTVAVTAARGAPAPQR